MLVVVTATIVYSILLSGGDCVKAGHEYREMNLLMERKRIWVLKNVVKFLFTI